MKHSIQLWFASGIALCCLTTIGQTQAQVVPDATLPNNSNVTLDGNTSIITGGTAAGSNLFHSFEQFSVPTGSEAFFNNALDIQNIISRVTGESISNIDGLIRANASANLFLLNPNGIIFGPNASLNIGGSFLGSTASSLNFADGTQFSAAAPQTTPLLSVSVPIGLQYGGPAGSIRNQSQVFNSSGQLVGLQVQPGKTLALVGGDVTLDGGRLRAEGGLVELGGVAGSGTVGLNFDGNNLSLSFPDGVERADVSLTNGASVDVIAGGGGSVAVNARNLDILGGSSLSAGIGPERGTVGLRAGDITLNATGATTISQFSSITNNFAIDAIGGEAGDINIKTGSLLINDFARVNTLQDRKNAQGQGDSGNITVQANGDVFLDTTGSGLDSALSTLSFGGNAGNVSVQANGSVYVSSSEIVTSSFGGAGGAILLQANGGSISVTNNSFIGSNVFNGQGDAGKISLISNGSVSVANISYITSSVDIAGESPPHTGNGGDIYIQGRSLSVTGGSQLANRTFSSGDAGKIEVNTSDFVEVSGRYPVIRPKEVSGIPKIMSDARLNGEGYSGFSTTSEEGASGLGGDISITTGILRVSDGGTLDAESRSTFKGGTITVNANVLEVTGGGQLLTTAFSSKDAGDINVNATDRITISGSNPTFSDIFNQLITLPKDPLNPVETLGEEEAERSIGPIDPVSGLFANTTTGSGFGGNITIQGGSIQLRNNSLISTEAGGNGNGGNITINADTLVGLENSDIVANANEGKGGFIQITAQGVFGLERSEQLTPLSDITAFSEQNPELNGVVEINTPDVDPSQGLVTLPAELVDVTGLIAQSCPASVRSGESKFIITGRGGLPPNPNEPLTGDNVLTEWNTLDSDIENRSSAEEGATNSAKESANTQIVEANGWIINNKGEVVLTATAPTATLDIPWLPDSDCNAP